MFTLFRFNLRFFRARSREIRGNYIAAAALLGRNDVPPRWQSLNDMYRIRLLVLGNSPSVGPEILETAKGLSWYQAPSSPGDHYAREYWNYMKAGVSGNVPDRQSAKQKLEAMAIRSIYRNSLQVTI